MTDRQADAPTSGIRTREDPSDDTRTVVATDRTVERVITLTDGVVAIAITLLALDLRPDVPRTATSHELAEYLGRNLGQYLSFAIAFGLIAQYWLAHRRLMNAVVRSSPAMLAATFLFLFGITLAPLTAYLQGDLSNPLATQIFAANVAFISLAAGLLGEVIRRQHLEEYRETRDERLRRETRSVVTVLIPILVAGLAPTVQGDSSWFFLLFVASNVPGRALLALRHRRRR